MNHPFNGPLARRFDEFMVLMLSTGGHHISLLATVRRLDHFLTKSFPRATSLTNEILRAWFASFGHLRPASQARYRTATFQVCKFLRRRDPTTATPENILPLRRSREFHPYIFAPEEITRLLRATRELRVRPTDPLRPWSMELVVVLLYTAGLRISEVARLEVRDYGPESATLIIRETKFAKTRLVVLSTSAQRLLDRYLERRRKFRITCDPTEPLQWCAGKRARSMSNTQIALRRLMRRCGMKPAQGREGPRVHDLRHTFAVHRVLDWYRKGLDVQALLPRLVTYLGHRGLDSTQRYLQLTPAVLREASARFDLFASLGACAKGGKR